MSTRPRHAACAGISRDEQRHMRGLPAALSGPVTVGAGVPERLTPGARLGGVRAKFLANTYDVIVRNLRLGGKAQFREKFGALGEQVCIYYPRHRLGVTDLQQSMKFWGG
ncbi:hypothetical protein F4815DRAFT_444039 [Daldinia loculata]|nr:hypothetical protein F4815DRAFT_444039 [Daldinia loculata]